MSCGRPAAKVDPPRAGDAAAAAETDAVAGATAIVHLSDESTIALLGVAALDLKDPDAPDLAHAMREAYARMRADEDAGLVKLEGDDHERMWLAPSKSSELGVVFLHGYGGRFALPCWQIAHALSFGARVACPSIGTEGDWWTARGKTIVLETITALRASGSKRIVLAGLSNGAIGVTRIASGLGVDAAIAISGADGTAPAPGVPALVIQGKTDAMSSAANAKAWASKAKATYFELDAGHFVMLRKHEDVEKALSDFVFSSARR